MVRIQKQRDKTYMKEARHRTFVIPWLVSPKVSSGVHQAVGNGCDRPRGSLWGKGGVFYLHLCSGYLTVDVLIFIKLWTLTLYTLLYDIFVLQLPSHVMSNSLKPHGLQHARLPCPSPFPRIAQVISTEWVKPFNRLIFCRPLLLLPSIFPSIRVFQWVSSLHHVAKVLELQLQHQSPQRVFRVDFL